jgi:hypothetical protein
MLMEIRSIGTALVLELLFTMVAVALRMAKLEYRDRP